MKCIPLLCFVHTKPRDFVICNMEGDVLLTNYR